MPGGPRAQPRTARSFPLADQRRELWDSAQIQEGVALITRTLGATPIGPYQLQAAIAAVHDEAPSAVAVAMVDGPLADLELIGTLDTDERMARTHRVDAVRGHLLELAGEPTAARESYLRPRGAPQACPSSAISRCGRPASAEYTGDRCRGGHHERGA